MPVIGLLGSAPRLGENPRDAALLQRLRELRWIEGRTVAIEYRWAENRFDRYPEIADEFVRLKVDVIVTFGTAVPARTRGPCALARRLARFSSNPFCSSARRRPSSRVLGGDSSRWRRRHPRPEPSTSQDGASM
jgi:putative ABC transport system substrate-binding protein